jgi:quercetin dioxygenase-like cupin family protein/GNAT superfamily N-acetyltransferase
MENPGMFAKHDAVPYALALPGIDRRTLCYGARMLMTEFRLQAGHMLPTHAHPQEQTGYLVSGRMQLRIGAEERELAPGDSWSIPGGVEHGATILEDSVALEVFSPVREDYLPQNAAQPGALSPKAPAAGQPIPVIARATAADAAELHELQRLAYRSEAELCGDWNIPPLVEPLAATERALADMVVLKATLGGRIVGSVRGRMVGATCNVGRLIVHPDNQGRGLGTRLMLELEAVLPQAKRFELFTGENSARNLHLYAKLGYIAFRTEPLSPKVMLVFLEKKRA